MRTSLEDRIALGQMHSQMNHNDRMERESRNEYFGHALDCDGDYRASRRHREFGYNENGEYWEE